VRRQIGPIAKVPAESSSDVAPFRGSLKFPCIVSTMIAVALNCFWIADSLPQIIHKCGEVFTNKPCDQLTTLPSNITAKEDSQEATKSRQDAAIRLKKEVLLHDLQSRAIRAKKELGIHSDLGNASEICKDPSASMNQCRAAVAKADTVLEERALNVRMARSAEAQATEAAKVIKQVPAQVNNQVVVVQPQWLPTATPPFVFDNGGVYPPRGPPFPLDPPGVGQPPASTLPNVGLPGYQIPRLPPYDDRPSHNSGVVDAVPRSSRPTRR
jgi:hypothetical protein